MSTISSSTAGPSGPPPPIPRRHPSRPSLRSVSSTETPPHPPLPLTQPDDGAERPPTVRRPTSSIFLGDEAAPKSGTVGLGYTGRVGLGSPRLEFFSRREGGSNAGLESSSEGKEGREAGGGKSGSYIHDHTGLPSPPGTESEVGMGLGIRSADTSLDDMSIPQLSTSKAKLRPRTPSVASSSSHTTHHPIPRSTSSATSHTQNSRRRLQPKLTTASSMTRSTSSSSSIYNLSLRDISLPGSPAGSPGMSDRALTPSPVKRSSPSISALDVVSQKSPSLNSSSSRLSKHSSRRSSGGLLSTGINHENGVKPTLSRHTSRLSVASYSSSDVDSQISAEKAGESNRRIVKPTISPPKTDTERSFRRVSDQSAGGPSRAQPPKAPSGGESAVKLLRRISGGADVDDRIRDAEEKVKRANQRSSRPSTAGSVQREEIPSNCRDDPLRHSPSTRFSPSIPTNGGTLRRSATLSSASARASNTPSVERGDTPEKGMGTAREKEKAIWEETERDRSGGSSGSGKRKPLPSEFRSTVPFTPSPKQANYPNVVSGSSRSGRVQQLAESPEERLSDLPSLSTHYTSPSSRRTERTESIDSPSSRFLRQEGIEGLDRSPKPPDRTREPYSRRQWSESLSGLPNFRSTADHRGLPSPNDSRGNIGRSSSMIDHHSSTGFDRYQSRSSTLSSSSRFAITPGDSVSVVDARPSYHDSGKKDPLEVLRRIEESRELHNRQWEEDRAGSVLGDFDSSPRAARRYERPESSEARRRMSEQPRIRPATSLSSVRDAFNRDSPRNGPIPRLSHRNLEDTQVDSPPSSAIRRTTSRLSHGPPTTEPRPMRSSTSLGGGRSGSSTEVFSTTRTEHGRLLLEAFRALELKLPPDLLDAIPDLVRALQATILTQETINSSIRDSIVTANHTNVAIDLGNPDIKLLRRDFDTLLPSLREASKASDQSIRELTRVILDLPKLLREGNRVAGGGGPSSRPGSRGQQPQSPTVRRSESIISRSSFDSTRSPEDARMRRWQNTTTTSGSPIPLQGGTRERRSLDVMRPSTSMATFVSRFRRSPGKGEMTPLPPIDQSPPRDSSEGQYEDKSYRRSEDYRMSGSSDRPSEMEFDSPVPTRDGEQSNGNRYSSSSSSAIPPQQSRSPERFRNILKKKASTTSTHTVRGNSTVTTGIGFSPLTQPTTTSTISKSSSFFPSPIRRTTTAISQITVGDLSSPPTRSKSFRSDRSSSLSKGAEELDIGSPVSRFSFGMEGRRSSGSIEDEDGDGEGDALKMLAAAAKRREGENRGDAERADVGTAGTGTGRWKSGWRRTSK